MSPSRSVFGTDRDALAVAFAKWNAEHNGTGGARFEAGLAYEHIVGQRFDLVVSNVPAKAGQAVHRLFLLGAQPFLAEGGEVWIVVVSTLKDSVERILGHKNVEVRETAVRRGHVVYRYAFRGPVPIPEHPYDRGEKRFGWKSVSYAMRAWHGLPEFDTLSLDTELCFSLLAEHLRREHPRSVAVWKPGHGHIPVFIAKASPDCPDLIIHSRDCLAIQATRGNLLLNEFSGTIDNRLFIDFSMTRQSARPELVVARLNPRLGHHVAEHAIRTWFSELPQCTVIVCGPSALISRLDGLLARSRIRVIRRCKKRGFSAARLECASGRPTIG